MDAGSNPKPPHAIQVNHLVESAVPSAEVPTEATFDPTAISKRPVKLWIAFGVVLAGTIGFWWLVFPNLHGPAIPIVVQSSSPLSKSPMAAGKPSMSPTRPSTAAEKAARVDQIKRDYDEIRRKAAAEYTAAGASFPGGVSAFLRQLALLEREKRRDLLTVLTPQELEDLELRESHAGQMVQYWLGDTAATDEQRRAVFRLQRDFDDQYALTFDLSPTVLLARERDRQALDEQVLGVLGNALFPAWVRRDGSDYDGFTAFASHHGLAPTVPLALWRVRNAFVLARLEVAANPAFAPEDVQAATARIAEQAEADARVVLGPAASDANRQNVLSWLPKP